MLDTVHEVTEKFRPAARRQESLLAPIEKKVLASLAGRMPTWVNSDHLTLFGFWGMGMAGGCYYSAKWNPLFLFGAVLFLGVNWFGDSLDGTLARFRNQQRPRYGFYVDHIIDSFGAVLLIGGLGLSGYMSGTIALGLIIAYFLLAIEVYLAAHALGIFRLSFGIWGPTELRILLAVGTLVLLKKPVVEIGTMKYLLCDVGGGIAIVLLASLVVYSTVQNTIQLYRLERLR